MTLPSIGPVVLHSDVAEAVRLTMQRWMPVKLSDIDEQQDRDRCTTKAPRLYVSASDLTRWAEETPPNLLVTCRTTVGNPDLHGRDGSYSAWYQVNIGITAGGATEKGTEVLAGRLAGAAQLVLAQQRDMDGTAEDTRWRGTMIDVEPRNRKHLAVEIVAHVRIRHVMNTRGLIQRDLPDTPCDAPAPLPQPSSARVTVSGQP